MTEIRIVKSALRDDVALWESVGSDEKKASSAASARTLSSSAFPQQTSTDLSPKYEEIVNKIVDLLVQGSEASESIAAELKNVLRLFESADEAAREAALKHLWELES